MMSFVCWSTCCWLKWVRIRSFKTCTGNYSIAGSFHQINQTPNHVHHTPNRVHHTPIHVHFSWYLHECSFLPIPTWMFIFAIPTWLLFFPIPTWLFIFPDTYMTVYFSRYLHASKHEAEIISLVMWCYVVQVEYSDLKHAVVRTETEIGDDQNGG